ncbi:MAG: ParB/RepB/Spo0J family partition protein [Treponema sp.]|nr:ParB/RepB/Spo0J family partition protein [Treponema sp.]
MAKKGGLGRGLEALMGSANKNETPSDFIGSVIGQKSNPSLPKGIEIDENGNLWVNPNLLIPNPKQPRKDFRQQELDELAESIREHGVIEPILIEKTDGDEFYIIAGERRTRAAKIAGVEKIPVQIRKYDDVKKLEIALIENIQRENLNPIEEAQAFYDLMQLGDLTQEEVARRVGKKRPTIANAVRLLKLPEDMQKSLVEGQISAGHARAILTVTNVSDMRILFGKIIGSNLSVHEAETLAQQYNNGGRAVTKSNVKPIQEKDPNLAEIEQKLIDTFGTKVTLKGNLDKGSIQIDYFSKDDLDRLYNIIVK